MSSFLRSFAVTTQHFELDSAAFLWALALRAETAPVVAADLLSTIETLIPLLARTDRAVTDDVRAQSDRLDLSVHGGYGDPKRVTQSVGREVRRILARLEA
ncbi:hypothetical protein DEJ33_00210 [Curtobacterium sp. MCPF17_047]|nr:hypothetical protein DEJ24_01195 [Curtobacterium sp. MCPF17_001]PZF68843.1 hypothetical protein DEJ33_00210 [Curtobacterium sp. MCPF17_047]